MDDYETVFWPLFLRAFRLAYAIVGNKPEAEDAAAEAMAKAHLHWGKIAALPYRDAWVLRVAGNEARTVVRRRRPDPHAAPPPPGFEDNVLARVALKAAVSSLPRRQREAITLRYLAGLDDAEIAATLRISPASVRTHVRRGLHALRADFSMEADTDVDA